MLIIPVKSMKAGLSLFIKLQSINNEADMLWCLEIIVTVFNGRIIGGYPIKDSVVIIK